MFDFVQAFPIILSKDRKMKSHHFTVFAEVASLGEALQATKKRLRLIEPVAEFLKNLSLSRNQAKIDKAG